MNVFIATLPRSGSTLLGMMLNQHSKCFNMGESFFWKKYVPGKVRCSCGSINCPFLAEAYGRIKDNTEVMNFFDICYTLDELPEIKDNIRINLELKKSIEESCVGLGLLADVFREIFKADIIIDTSTNIRIAERLLRESDWKILLLTRNPNGLLNSYKKAAKRHGEEVSSEAKIRVITDFAEKAIELQKNQKVLLVKYESICHRPDKELKRICRFLNIDYEEAMLDFKNDLGHTVMGNRMRFDNNREIVEDLSWLKELNQTEKKLLAENSILISLYKKLGYKLL